jgi:hypothetical protein
VDDSEAEQLLRLVRGVAGARGRDASSQARRVEEAGVVWDGNRDCGRAYEKLLAAALALALGHSHTTRQPAAYLALCRGSTGEPNGVRTREERSEPARLILLLCGIVV